MTKNVAEKKAICSELLTLTYGSFVTQLIKDLPDIDAVNEKLYKSGYNIGVRLIEDFLSKNSEINCYDFRETADTISKNAFKLYMNITPAVTNWSQDYSEFSLIFENNPLAESVELPPAMETLWYSNILPGVIKGALEMVMLDVDAYFVKDQLRGDGHCEIRVKLIKKREPMAPLDE